jgi:hypothetical protein
VTSVSRRSGTKRARISDNRYFYVLGEGWYVLTREGESGPYTEKAKAEEFVNIVLTGNQPLDLLSIQS